MVNITGWKGKIKARGALYPRYKNRALGLKGGYEMRDTNTGRVFTSDGKLKGVEPNGQHIYGHDTSNNEKAGIFPVKKIKGEL